MTEQELYDKLVEISGVSDFHLELKQTYSESYWGRYFPGRKLIRLYALQECGEQYPDDIIIREGLHELTHHIQYHHIPFWERRKGVMHDEDFWNIFEGMLKSFFGKGLKELKELQEY